MVNTEIVIVNKPISISTTPAAESINNKTSRRVHISIADINEIPEELFAVKISQSKKPEKAGKVVFKYLTYRQAGTEEIRQDFAPNGVTTATPVADIKALFVNFLAQQGLKLEFSVTINLLGNFSNIETPEGRLTIFDNNEFPATEGNPGYYLKAGTIATVSLKEMKSNYGGSFFSVRLKTEQAPAEIFVRGGRAKVYDFGESSAPSFTEPVAPVAPVAPEAPATGSLW